MKRSWLPHPAREIRRVSVCPATGEVPFLTEGGALQEAARIALRSSLINLRSVECAACRGWHLVNAAPAANPADTPRRRSAAP